MTENQVMSPLVKGLIIGLVLAVLAALVYVLVPDVSKHQKFGWLTWILIIGATAWASYSYVKQMNGQVTTGNAFAHGFKATAVMTLVMVVYTALSLLVIFPESKGKAMEAARIEMEKNDQISDAQIDSSVEMMENYFIPFAIGGTVIMYLILGAIGSIAGAAAAPKKPMNEPFS